MPPPDGLELHVVLPVLVLQSYKSKDASFSSKVHGAGKVFMYFSWNDSSDFTKDGFTCIRLQSEEQGKDYQQQFFSESEMAQHATPKVNLLGTFSAHSFYIND